MERRRWVLEKCRRLQRNDLLGCLLLLELRLRERRHEA